MPMVYLLLSSDVNKIFFSSEEAMGHLSKLQDGEIKEFDSTIKAQRYWSKRNGQSFQADIIKTNQFSTPKLKPIVIVTESERLTDVSPSDKPLSVIQENRINILKRRLYEEMNPANKKQNLQNLSFRDTSPTSSSQKPKPAPIADVSNDFLSWLNMKEDVAKTYNHLKCTACKLTLIDPQLNEFRLLGIDTQEVYIWKEFSYPNLTSSQLWSRALVRLFEMCPQAMSVTLVDEHILYPLLVDSWPEILKGNVNMYQAINPMDVMYNNMIMIRELYSELISIQTSIKHRQIQWLSE